MMVRLPLQCVGCQSQVICEFEFRHEVVMIRRQGLVKGDEFNENSCKDMLQLKQNLLLKNPQPSCGAGASQDEVSDFEDRKVQQIKPRMAPMAPAMAKAMKVAQAADTVVVELQMTMKNLPASSSDSGLSKPKEQPEIEDC